MLSGMRGDAQFVIAGKRDGSACFEGQPYKYSVYRHDFGAAGHLSMTRMDEGLTKQNFVMLRWPARKNAMVFAHCLGRRPSKHAMAPSHAGNDINFGLELS
jgi:hypothetical protein